MKKFFLMIAVMGSNFAFADLQPAYEKHVMSVIWAEEQVLLRSETGEDMITLICKGRESVVTPALQAGIDLGQPVEVSLETYRPGYLGCIYDVQVTPQPELY